MSYGQKVYDREGNVITLLDWSGNDITDQIRSVKVVERRTAQFRLTPMLWWSAWAGVLLGWLTTLVSFILACVGIATSHDAMLWAFTALGFVLGIAAFFSTMGLAEYHKKHGMPKRIKEQPKAYYCKNCQTQLENDLKISEEQRRIELLAELESLGGIPEQVPALEAAPDPGVWQPPTDAESDPVNRRRF